MKARLAVIPLLFLALASCDKAKSIVNKTSSKVQEKIAANDGHEDSMKVDPELQNLVDHNEEGFVFRKDLPFPSRLEVRTTRIREISGRFYRTSAIERHSETVKGTETTVFKLERSADAIRYTPEQSGFVLPTAEKGDTEKKAVANPLEKLTRSVKPVTFRKNGMSWRSDDSDGFRAAVLSRQLSPVFDQLLIDNALAPRAHWFSKRRVKPGDQLVIEGASLPMLLAGNAKGTLKLRFETTEAVGGHPCGVFSITGDFKRTDFPDFEGNQVNEDVTIQSGKVWLSLVHPVILKEEFDTVQTFKSGGQGGLDERGQGSVKTSVKRDWKVLKSP